jgi:acyl carrier protein
VPGELYIGGASQRRGYLKRPDLTAEKFIPNPFSGEPGSRLYKTGDLTRYLAVELRSFLKQKLPDYMIPSALVFLEALPRTSNGKVDRRALPAPEQNRPEQENPFVPPSTVAQKAITEIWAQVLKVDRVGIHDNFFELGGHSLLAIEIVSRLRDVFQIDLPLRSLFENPTVAGLAAQVVVNKTPSEETASVLADLESLTDEEARLLLAQESSKSR